MLNLAINHMSFPNASFEAILEMASENACAGVEVRNDLSGDIFTGATPQQAGSMARARGVRLLALAQLNEFNNMSDSRRDQAQQLIDIAVESGAESVCLIPLNDGSECSSADRKQQLTTALTELKPLFEQGGLVGMVEPLGFTSSSLRYKRDAVEVIDAIDGAGCFQLVHDTFHHFIAGETAFFPEHTGMVHVSGVTKTGIVASEMTDAHRGFVDADDQLQNVSQLKNLLRAGYRGPISMEVFSPQVHASNDSTLKLAESFNYITCAVGEC